MSVYSIVQDDHSLGLRVGERAMMRFEFGLEVVASNACGSQGWLFLDGRYTTRRRQDLPRARAS